MFGAILVVGVMVTAGVREWCVRVSIREVEHEGWHTRVECKGRRTRSGAPRSAYDK
jgi:hypothetical protein